MRWPPIISRGGVGVGGGVGRVCALEEKKEKKKRRENVEGRRGRSGPGSGEWV